MIIQSNKMMPPSPRIISFHKCSVISTDGPRIVGKIDLTDVNINYESQLYSRIILNPQTENQPILYGGLGNEVTFLFLKLTYDETDPTIGILQEDLYIQYWLADNPTNVKYTSKLLLLTGNSTNRIPQIYLNNPHDSTIYVDVFMSNLEASEYSFTTTLPSYTFSDLYFNYIVSDITGLSGSTQFNILDSGNTTQLSINYDDILTQIINYNNNRITVTTSGSTITLNFINEFEVNQANSRMLWVLDSSSDRYLSKTNPPLDAIEPNMQIYSGLTPVDLTGNTYIYDYITGTTIMPFDVLFYFVSGITDNRDGVIDINETTITIRDNNMDILTGITEIGDYDVVMYIADNANNVSIFHIILRVGDFIIIEAGETYYVPSGTTELNLVYSGGENTSSDLVISGITITVANSGGSFVWDLGGSDEHTFTYIGESIGVFVGGISYQITWNGYGSLIFNMKIAIDWLMETGYWDNLEIWDNNEYWISA